MICELTSSRSRSSFAAMDALSVKVEALRTWLIRRERVVVAFSGGVDSTFLLSVAAETLGERAEAVTARSPSLPRAEADAATALAAAIGVRHRFIDTGELDDPRYVANDRERCYYCKAELFGHLADLAAEGVTICTGAIADDASDYRPGERAAGEAGVHAPLAECGFTKAEVRAASQALGLPTWDKPASACLASRIPHGTPVSAEALGRVERAEAALHALGVRDCRVRHHDDLARIEVPLADLPALCGPERRAAVLAAVRGAGYRHVTIDLAGYRPAGSI